MKRRRLPFSCIAIALPHAYRGLLRSEDMRLFGALLVMMEELKASFLSVLYGPNRSLSPGEDNQFFKEWCYVK